MRTALTMAGLALVIGGLAGCGGDDDPPADASKADFCANFSALNDDLGELGADDEDAALDVLKDAISKMEDTGTPEGIPDDAREGLQITIDAINGLDDDATGEDLEKLDEGMSDADQDKSDAFDDYLSTTCDL